MTLAKRKTRFEVIFKLDGKDARSVNKAIQDLQKRSGEYFDHRFKTITKEDGSEFSGLHEALHDTVDVYFSHPYTSWLRRTSETQHKLIRCFIPKRSPISNGSETQLIRIQQWMNDYPIIILDYQMPYNCLVKAFKEEHLAA